MKIKPHFYIGGEQNPYIRRWHLIPRNRFFNIYLHHILRDDDDRALHYHPWASCSIILKGGYWEHTFKGKFWRKPWRIYFRRACAAHRLELEKQYFDYFPPDNKPCWSLFITGPKVREWGFHCPQGWRHWRDFVDARDSGKVGRGCE